MNFDRLYQKNATVFFAPEYGGDAVSGGGHPADSAVPATEAIDDAFAQEPGGGGKIRGIGVPGSRTNPVSHDEISRRARGILGAEGRPARTAGEPRTRAGNKQNQEQTS